MANHKIFMVATAHLDTQWTWDARQTVHRYLPDTISKNITLFQTFPGYRFNFEGAFRYALIQEYYPAEFEKIKRWQRTGRWNLTGATWESMDVLVPSSESIIRQILYGSEFFREHFGRSPRDLFLPDCFGFGFNLPTIARHMGLQGFSTQKLAWNKASAIPIPFALGKWHGNDGNFIYAALDPGDYENRIDGPLRQDNLTRDQLIRNDGLSLRYFGTGDIGGAPDHESVRNLESDLGEKNGIEVISATPDDVYQEMAKRDLPSYSGELLLRRHGVGCYTSRAIAKRWNAQCERLADAAERINALASALGYPYPKEEIDRSWKRFLWHQFHDDLSGTSIPEAYQIAYNDYIVSLNQLSEELIGGVRNVSAQMDTTGPGVPIIVYNPVAFERCEPVSVRIPEGDYQVFLGETAVPSQRKGDVLQFLADAPGSGLKVYHIAPAQTKQSNPLLYSKTDQHIFQNEYYKVIVDQTGDIVSIYDIEMKLELLEDPIRLVRFDNDSQKWPAWEILYHDLESPEALDYSEVEIELLEQGPVRLSLQVKRRFSHSDVIQRIHLMAGVRRVEIEHEIDWFEQASLLKLDFVLSLSPDLAAYDCGAGVVYRGVNKTNLYEVPAQEFVSLSSDDQTISLMSDCKYGWDRPEKNRLRLSLIHTPRGSFGPAKQHLQDLGEHRFTVAITSHHGSFDQATIETAQAFRQPMRSFYSEPHHGVLGNEISLISTIQPGLKVMALKQAQDSDKLVVRVQDVSGKSLPDRRLIFAKRVMTVHEINGQEELIPGRVMIEGSSVKFDLNRNSLKSFVVQMEPLIDEEVSIAQQPLNLLFNSDAYSPEGSQKIHPRFPMEQMPETIRSRGIRFQIDPTKVYSAMRCEGQKVILPEGYRDLVFLAASLEDDVTAEYNVDGKKQTLLIPSWREPVGDWDDFAGKRYGGIKTVPIAWQANHIHTPEGNQPFEYGYMFRFSIRGKKIYFPKDSSVVVFAANAVMVPDVEAADDLYDQRSPRPTFHLEVEGGHGSGDYPLHAPMDLKPEVPEQSAFVGWEPDLRRMPVGDVVIRAVFEPLGIDLASHAKVEACGDSPEGEEAAHVIQTGAAKWCSLKEGDKWLILDLGSPQTIRRYHIRHAGAGGESELYNTKDFELQVEQEHGWETIDRVRDNRSDYSLRSIEPTTGQRFRLLITRSEQYGNRAARIYGLELYGGNHV
ncbi:MAG TPA: hypothetical protein GXZ74_06995 [Tissierellia bacterium]|nr:hypothetical protein [Tissierellia bacterium]